MRAATIIAFATFPILMVFSCRSQSYSGSPPEKISPITTNPYSLRLKLDQSTNTPAETVGFDRIQRIFVDPQYGPCSKCHEHQWPYFSKQGWQDFEKSLTKPNGKILTKTDLATRILGCVDPKSEVACAGDPEDSTDNIDFKMPSKYGLPSVLEDDILLIEQWLMQGINEFSNIERVPVSTQQFQFYVITRTSSPEIPLSLEGDIDRSQGTELIFFNLISEKSGCREQNFRLDILNESKIKLASGSFSIACHEGLKIAPTEVIIK